MDTNKSTARVQLQGTMMLWKSHTGLYPVLIYWKLDDEQHCPTLWVFGSLICKSRIISFRVVDIVNFKTVGKNLKKQNKKKIVGKILSTVSGIQ